MYATIQDLRDEGVREEDASDARLLRLIREASQEVDLATGTFFEPRSLTFVLDGRGAASLELPAPPIELTQVSVGGSLIPHGPAHMVVVGAPVGPAFDVGRITRRYGVFPKGHGNVTVAGTFGYTVPGQDPHGETPAPIRRATILMVLQSLAPLASPDGRDARSMRRLIEERTRDQSYKLQAQAESMGASGDPDIDRILIRFRRPSPMGAA